MAIFSDLPNELILGIWGYVIAPDDVESLALVSKRLYGLSSQSVNEHASLKRQYSRVHLPYREGNYEPADLLVKMLLDTRISFYIDDLHLTYWTPQWKEQTTPQAYDKDTMSLFEGAIRASPLVTGPEVEDWITDVGKGNEDPLIALILMRLTKIKRFRYFEVAGSVGPYLLRTLKRITQSPKAAVQRRQSITGTGTNGDDQITCTRPSVFFTVNNLGMSSPDLTFDKVSQLLRCINGLKDFRYWGRRGTKFEISHLCDILLECSQFSLQKLSIHGEDTGLGDITQFQVLAEVFIKFEALLGDRDDTCRNLADVLPMSIEILEIHVPSSEGPVPSQIPRRVILDMIKCKMERLPKLQGLTFDFGLWTDEAITRNILLIEELQGMSATVGVLLRAWGKKVDPASVRS